jgi:LysM repeat protein
MMKFKILVLTAFLLTNALSLFAKPLTDSIGVENKDGKKVILHKLDPKDNYFSLGRRYHVSPKAIIQFNNNAALVIGNVVKVPTDRPFLESSYNTPKAQTPPAPVVQAPVNKPAVPQVIKQQPVPTPAQTQQVVAAEAAPIPTQDYKVSAGETLYSIAKRFNTSVDVLTNINSLPSTTLAPGQLLKVPASATAQPTYVQPAQVVAKQDNTAAVVAADSSNANKFNANKFGLYEKDEKGVATWIDDTSLDPAKKLVLHRTAPIGTVIKITNPMTNLTTYAKVVGRISDNESTKDVIIVITKNVADSLGALDKRFHVNISYGSPNE